jgi:tetratricopeptide (TPR) repeat protein
MKKGRHSIKHIKFILGEIDSMLEENQVPSPKTTGEFQASPDAIEAGVDLESARIAYQIALDNLLAEFPDIKEDSHLQSVELKHRNALQQFLQIPRGLLAGLINIPLSILGEAKEIVVETRADLRATLGDKTARYEEAQRNARSLNLQNLLLEVLWARDYVQYVLEQPEPVPYHVKRKTLQYLMQNDDLLDNLRRRAVDEGELNPIKLRKSQPTIPRADAWWWFLDNRRIRRARRVNAFWFVAAVVPSLAAIILITLLTQRLAIDGPDMLSGASALAQLVLGAGSILAGRELLAMFFFDRSSGRSWQGEATFALATLFLAVVASFYAFAPPAAALVYNWFGQQAIKSGNAAEAELYLESAARLDPDPHAANLQEVGCLYLNFGSSERAQSVFERVLEADSRLLLSRHHLAEIYIEEGNYETARRLVNDGVNLVTTARARLGDDDFLPKVSDEITIDRLEYLLKLSLARAQLEVGDVQSAIQNLREAEDIYDRLEATGIFRAAVQGETVEFPCTFDGTSLDSYIEITEHDLLYLNARTIEATCVAGDNQAVKTAWTSVVRSRSYNTRQETQVAEAKERVNSDICQALVEETPE